MELRDPEHFAHARSRLPKAEGPSILKFAKVRFEELRSQELLIQRPQLGGHVLVAEHFGEPAAAFLA